MSIAYKSLEYLENIIVVTYWRQVSGVNIVFAKERKYSHVETRAEPVDGSANPGDTVYIGMIRQPNIKPKIETAIDGDQIHSQRANVSREPPNASPIRDG